MVELSRRELQLAEEVDGGPGRAVIACRKWTIIPLREGSTSVRSVFSALSEDDLQGVLEDYVGPCEVRLLPHKAPAKEHSGPNRHIRTVFIVDFKPDGKRGWSADDLIVLAMAKLYPFSFRADRFKPKERNLKKSCFVPGLEDLDRWQWRRTEGRGPGDPPMPPATYYGPNDFEWRLTRVPPGWKVHVKPTKAWPPVFWLEQPKPQRFSPTRYIQLFEYQLGGDEGDLKHWQRSTVYNKNFPLYDKRVELPLPGGNHQVPQIRGSEALVDDTPSQDEGSPKSQQKVLQGRSDAQGARAQSPLAHRPKSSTSRSTPESERSSKGSGQSGAASTSDHPASQSRSNKKEKQREEAPSRRGKWGSRWSEIDSDAGSERSSDESRISIVDLTGEDPVSESKANKKDKQRAETPPSSKKPIGKRSDKDSDGGSERTSNDSRVSIIDLTGEEPVGKRMTHKKEKQKAEPRPSSKESGGKRSEKHRDAAIKGAKIAEKYPWFRKPEGK